MKEEREREIEKVFIGRWLEPAFRMDYKRMLAIEREGLEVLVEWEVGWIEGYKILNIGVAYYDRQERKFLIKDVQVRYEKCSCSRLNDIAGKRDGRDIFPGRRERNLNYVATIRDWTYRRCRG